MKKRTKNTETKVQCSGTFYIPPVSRGLRVHIDDDQGVRIMSYALSNKGGLTWDAVVPGQEVVTCAGNLYRLELYFLQTDPPKDHESYCAHAKIGCCTCRVGDI